MVTWYQLEYMARVISHWATNCWCRHPPRSNNWSRNLKNIRKNVCGSAPVCRTDVLHFLWLRLKLMLHTKIYATRDYSLLHFRNLRFNFWLLTSVRSLKHMRKTRSRGSLSFLSVLVAHWPCDHPFHWRGIFRNLTYCKNIRTCFIYIAVIVKIYFITIYCVHLFLHLFYTAFIWTYYILNLIYFFKIFTYLMTFKHFLEVYYCSIFQIDRLPIPNVLHLCHKGSCCWDSSILRHLYFKKITCIKWNFMCCMLFWYVLVLHVDTVKYVLLPIKSATHKQNLSEIVSFDEIRE